MTIECRGAECSNTMNFYSKVPYGRGHHLLQCSSCKSITEVTNAGVIVEIFTAGSDGYSKRNAVVNNNRHVTTSG